ncbi:unnamed protein product [Sphagnum balticum]
MKFAMMVLSVLTVFAMTPNAKAQAPAPGRRAAPPAKRYKPYVTPSNPIDTRWASVHSPWDFTAMLGIYNPGFGFGARAAYRILNSILEDVDDSLSVEAGIGYIGASNTYGGVNSSYSLIEIPVLARWDFRLDNARFVVGPLAGFSFLGGSSVTVNGTNYSTGGGTLYFEVGGEGMYRFNDNWAIRANLEFGGYFNIAAGATYFL